MHIILKVKTVKIIITANICILCKKILKIVYNFYNISVFVSSQKYRIRYSLLAKWPKNNICCRIQVVICFCVPRFVNTRTKLFHRRSGKQSLKKNFFCDTLMIAPYQAIKLRHKMRIFKWHKLLNHLNPWL